MTGGAGDEQVARTFDLLVAGDLNPDVVLTGVPAELGAGQHERLVSTAVLTVGGSAGIVACGAARLGLRTAFASIVGDDDAGRYVLHELAAREVDVGGVAVQEGLPTGLSVSLVRASRDDRAILTAPGCIPLFEAATIDRHAAALRPPLARDVVLSAAQTRRRPAESVRRGARRRTLDLARLQRRSGKRVGSGPPGDPAGRRPSFCQRPRDAGDSGPLRRARAGA